MAKETYRALIGFSYPPKDTYAEVGTLVTDLTPASVRVLLEAGAIELASAQEDTTIIEETVAETVADETIVEEDVDASQTR